MAYYRHVNIVILIILTLNFAKIIQAQHCTTQKNCAECIQSKDHCAWCQKPDTTSGNQTSTKCNSQSFYDSSGSRNCIVGNLVNPANTKNLDEDDEISSGSTDSSKVVQIRPQHVSLKLRVGQGEEINIQFAQAKDYPVDLYYLMDLSHSMKDDKDKLTTFGELLTKRMTEVTSKFKIGFGSFVDKVVMPFVSTIEKKLQRPCGNDEECVPPYSFRNHLKLTSEFSRFTVEVNNSKASGNLDSPEGGLDGIMQVAVCEDFIGWRKDARKFVVFATDASFHFAGDGKLAGIVKPNDAECHLDSSGSYTHAEILDYPSIAQINSVVKKKVINVIFAVTQDQLGIYNSLKSSIEGSAVGVLTSDSSNVVELVTAEYQKITSTIEMKSTASDEVLVTYFTNCGNEAEEISKKSRCIGVPIGTIVNFTAKVEVLKCPSNPSEWKQQFEIYTVGVAERITIDLEIICGCEECENLETPKASECSKAGTLSCGTCRCDPTYFGEQCQCNDQSGQGSDDEWRCRNENSTDICSKRGQCSCGQCVCNRREDKNEEITGRFCECDNFSCNRGNGLLCSGIDHGSCKCGHCNCEKSWNGTACECSLDDSTCKIPGETEICSGKGECICGGCKCQQTSNETYWGSHCEHCRGCADECDEIAECVQCKVHKTGNLADCENVCKQYTNLQEVDYISDNGTNGETFCLANTTDGCRFYFNYGRSATREIYINAQSTKECPPEAPVGLIIGGGMGTIVIVGLISILLWKICTTIQDRQEYARFEQDNQKAKFNSQMNPLYKEATSTFQNPSYAGMNS